MKHFITTLFFLCAFTMNAQTHDVTGPTKQQADKKENNQPAPKAAPPTASPKPRSKKGGGTKPSGKSAEDFCKEGTWAYDSHNYVEVAEKWLKAAEKGNAEGQGLIGWCYYYGIGIDQDYSEAVKWLSKVAEKGYPQAFCFLGLCYENGDGVSQNYSEAFKWYEASAK